MQIYQDMGACTRRYGTGGKLPRQKRCTISPAFAHVQICNIGKDKILAEFFPQKNGPVNDDF